MALNKEVYPLRKNVINLSELEAVIHHFKAMHVR